MIWRWNDPDPDSKERTGPRFFHWGLCLDGPSLLPKLYTVDVQAHPIPEPHDTVYRSKNMDHLSPGSDGPFVFEKLVYPITAERFDVGSLLRVRIAIIRDRKRLERILHLEPPVTGDRAGPLGSRHWMFNALGSASEAKGVIECSGDLDSAVAEKTLVATMELLLDDQLIKGRYRGESCPGSLGCPSGMIYFALLTQGISAASRSFRDRRRLREAAR